MAARRKTGAKKSRASAKKKRASSRLPAAAPKKTNASSKTVSRKATASFKKSTRAKTAPKTRAKAALKPRAKAAPKTRAKAAPKKKAAARKRLTPAQKGAITRAINQFLALGTRRVWWSPQRKGWYEERRAAVVRALERAGYRLEAIRARLKAIRDSRYQRRKKVAQERFTALGTTLLDQKTPDGQWAEADRRSTLAQMILNRDRRFVDYVRTVQDQFGLEYQEAVNEWFSPKLLEWS